MKKILHSSLLTLALVGSSCTLAWFGNTNMADAYMYGLNNDNPTSYPLVMTDGVNLCYTQMGTGIYIDEKTAHVVSQEGNVYTLSASFIRWYQNSGKLIPEDITYKYDTSTHTIYYNVQGKDYVLEHTDSPAQVTLRSAAEAMQIWHAVMGTDWEW